MDLHLLPLLWQDLARSLAALLHQRAAWRLLAHLPSCCLASSSPRAAAWLPAGCGLRRQPTTPPTTTFLSALGRRADLLAGVLLQHALRHVAPAGPLLFARDDTLTPRYGPHVQGAGVHHNPTPGPTDQRFVYGHVWVSLAGVAWHSLWGAIALPLRALLYVRAKDMPRVPRRYRWVFRTKLALAADLVGWATRWARVLGRAVRVVADGFYAKRPFLRAAARAGITVISRLRREAALRPLPRRPPADHRRRGRPAVYGSGRISLAKRAGQRRGWQLVPARQYGKVRAKTSKAFLATWRPAGGRIRVVLVREPHGWLTLFSTDVSLTAEEISHPGFATALRRLGTPSAAVSGWQPGRTDR